MGVILAILLLLTTGMPLHADSGQKEQSNDMSVTVSGDVKVDVDASGPAQLKIQASGPSKVWICTGNECKLEVQVEEPAEVNVTEDCGQITNSNEKTMGLEIIPGVLLVESVHLFTKSDSTGHMVIIFLGERYEF